MFKTRFIPSLKGLFVQFSIITILLIPKVSIGQQWVQIGQDIDGEVTNDRFGTNIAISGNGQIVAIGAKSNDFNGENSGYVRVFQNISGDWIQLGNDINGDNPNDYFGVVSLSNDGSILAVGAGGNDSNGDASGQVKVYEFVSGTWIQLGNEINGLHPEDAFGASTSLSNDGSILAVGARGSDTNGDYSGQARVFENIAGVWTQIGNEINGEAAGDTFNSSLPVSLSGNGQVLAMSAHLNDGNGFASGHTRVFENIAGVWTQIGDDIDGAQSGDRSGTTISLSHDGKIVAIGSPANSDNGISSGHVRIFENIAGVWTQIGDNIEGENPSDLSSQANGLSLSGNGKFVAIGARLNDGNGDSSGHVRVFENVLGNWIQVGDDINGEHEGDWSGWDVKLSDDGRTVAIGAPSNDDNGENSGHVRVYESPFPVITDLIVCDDNLDGDDNNGFVQSFDLSSKDIEILNGQNSADYVITYYETYVEATTGSNELSSPYSNIVAYNQTIFYRIKNITTENFHIGWFDLVVNPILNIATPVDYELCDDNNPGDLVEIFDLVSMNDTVTMGDASLLVSYHLTQADAEAGVNPLPDMYENTTPSMQTIYTRVVNPVTTCYSTGEMNLIVNPLPAANQPAPIDFCNDDNDDSGTFDLDAVIPQITTNPNMDVTFHLTQDEADAGSNPIPSPYTNASDENPQIIYIRVENQTTGCFNTALQLTLNVIYISEIPQDISDYVICDDDQDGSAVFNLMRQDRLDEIFSDPDLAGTPADYTVTFHLTQADADAGLPIIATPTAYTNTSNPQTLWVRVEHNNTNCFVTREFDLVVNNAPIDDTMVATPLIICDDLGQVNDGISVFDLTVKNDEIAQGNTNVTITYYPSVADATAGTNAITDPTAYTNVTNPQTLGVIVTDTTTGCSSQTILTIEVKPNPTPYTGAIPTLMACDNDSDGLATFDLHENDALILSTDALSQITGYFTSYDDAVNDVNDINDTGNPAAYVNTTNPQTIWVRVENTATGCFEIVSFDIYNPIPTVSLTVDQPVLCVDADGNPLNTVTISTGLDPALYTFAWEYNGTALPDTTASITATAAGTYTVTVSNANGDGCFNIASITIDSSSPPFTYSASVTTVAFAADHVIEATATGNGVYQFSLDGGPFQDSGIFTGVEPRLHYVTIRDVNGCGEVVVEVCVIDYPKYFTPNADGYHDTWNIIGGQCGNITELYIFDRYGKLLKQLDPNGNGWDGTYNGNPLPSTDYWFKLLYIEDGVEKEFRNHFAMKR